MGNMLFYVIVVVFGNSTWLLYNWTSSSFLIVYLLYCKSLHKRRIWIVHICWIRPLRVQLLLLLRIHLVNMPQYHMYNSWTKLHRWALKWVHPNLGLRWWYWWYGYQLISNCIGRYLLKYFYWKAKILIRNVAVDILNLNPN